MTDLLFAFDQQALIVKDVQESFLSFFHPLLFFLRHFDSIPYYLLFTASIVSLCPKKEGESALYLVVILFIPFGKIFEKVIDVKVFIEVFVAVVRRNIVGSFLWLVLTERKTGLIQRMVSRAVLSFDLKSDGYQTDKKP